VACLLFKHSNRPSSSKRSHPSNPAHAPRASVRLTSEHLLLVVSTAQPQVTMTKSSKFGGSTDSMIDDKRLSTAGGFRDLFPFPKGKKKPEQTTGERMRELATGINASSGIIVTRLRARDTSHVRRWRATVANNQCVLCVCLTRCYLTSVQTWYDRMQGGFGEAIPPEPGTWPSKSPSADHVLLFVKLHLQVECCRMEQIIVLNLPWVACSAVKR